MHTYFSFNMKCKIFIHLFIDLLESIEIKSLLIEYTSYANDISIKKKRNTITYNFDLLYVSNTLFKFLLLFHFANILITLS